MIENRRKKTHTNSLEKPHICACARKERRRSELIREIENDRVKGGEEKEKNIEREEIVKMGNGGGRTRNRKKKERNKD